MLYSKRGGFQSHIASDRSATPCALPTSWESLQNLLHHNSPCCYFGQYHIVTVTCSLHHLVYKHPLPTRWVVEKFQKVQKQPASDQSNQMEACGAVSNTSNHMGNTDLSLAGGGCWRWLNSL